MQNMFKFIFRILLLGLLSACAVIDPVEHSESFTNEYQFGGAAHGLMHAGYQGDIRNAIKVLDKGLGRYPESAYLYRYRASAKLMLNDVEGAKNDLLAASRISTMGEEFFNWFDNFYPSNELARKIENEVDEQITVNKTRPFVTGGSNVALTDRPDIHKVQPEPAQQPENVEDTASYTTPFFIYQRVLINGEKLLRKTPYHGKTGSFTFKTMVGLGEFPVQDSDTPLELVFFVNVRLKGSVIIGDYRLIPAGTMIANADYPSSDVGNIEVFYSSNEGIVIVLDQQQINLLGTFID